MKRRIIFPTLTATLAAVLFPVISSAGRTPSTPDARAARVESRVVAKTQEAVRAYWTEERLRRAQPLELELEDPIPVPAAGSGGQDARPVRIGPSAPELAFGDPIPFNRFEITDPSAEPFRKHGKVYFSQGDYDYVCSGTVVTSASESLLVTAGHCVYDEATNEWSTNFMFRPAFKGPSSAPFGSWVATNLFTLVAWQDGNIDYDLGMAALGQNSGQTIQDVVGARGIAFNQTALGTPFQAIGYPAAPPFSGDKMYECDSSVAYRDGTYAVAPMAIGCDMTGGSSGGGWVRDGAYVNSVVSYGYVGLPDVLFGPYFGDAAESLYELSGGGPSPTPTPTPTLTPTPTPTPTPGTNWHPTKLTLALKRHLVAKGTLSATDGFGACAAGAEVWIFSGTHVLPKYIGETATGWDGSYKVHLKDRARRYFAFSPTRKIDATNGCDAAWSPFRRHVH